MHVIPSDANKRIEMEGSTMEYEYPIDLDWVMKR